MDKNLWQKLNKPFSILAPMANVTDWAFRQIILENGRPDVFYTEFISCDGICAVGKEKFKGELYFEKNEKPIIVQFFTSNPENLKRCVNLAGELGFDGVDINMGCPDKSVEKQNAGASLIKDSELAKKLIRVAKAEAGDMPISVKTRIGYNKIETDSWIPNLLEAEPDCLIVHGRTRKEMSKVPAHWDEIAKARSYTREAGIPIVGNGDVKNLNELKDKAKEYDLDGIMIGRGIFDNPWLFNEKIDPKFISPSQRIETMIHHCELFEKLWGQNKNFDVLKRFFKIYIQSWPGAKDLRAELMMSKSIEQVKKIAQSYKKQAVDI